MPPSPSIAALADLPVLVTSNGSGVALPPVGDDLIGDSLALAARSMSLTDDRRRPLLARAWEMARPIPCPAPVTRARCPLRSIVECHRGQALATS